MSRTSGTEASASGQAATLPPLKVGARPHAGTVDYPGGQIAWIQACLKHDVVSILCGRDVGKTIFIWFLLFEEARRCHGYYDFAYIAQGHPQAEKFYEWCRSQFEESGLLVGFKNKGQDRWIKLRPFENNRGVTIHFWSGEEGALTNIRGVRLNRLAVDEAGFVSPEVRTACRGMLLSRGGKQVFVGTARRGGMGFVWFKEAYDRGWDGVPGYCSFNAPSESNPFTPPGAVERARMEYRDRHAPDVKTAEEREEFDGEFVSDLGACFRKLDAAFCLPILRTEPYGLWIGKDPQPERHYVLGQDWGKMHDHSCSSVFDRETREQVALRIESRGVDYDDQMARLDQLHRRYNKALIIADVGDAGAYINERLGKQYGDRLVPMRLTAHGERNKGFHVARLKHLFDTEGWSLLKVPTQVDEFTIFQQTPIGEHGNGFYYEAPRGKHDDTVTAAIFAASVLQIDIIRQKPTPDIPVLKPGEVSMEWFAQRQRERIAANLRAWRRRGF